MVIPSQNIGQIVQVSEKHRNALALAYAQKRTADAEATTARMKVERLIEKLDTDGSLSAAIREAGTAQARRQAADAKLNGILTEVQKEVGPLTGMRVDADTGNLIKPLASPGLPLSLAADAPATARARKFKK